MNQIQDRSKLIFASEDFVPQMRRIKRAVSRQRSAFSTKEDPTASSIQLS
jgi:hypothetical protein